MINFRIIFNILGRLLILEGGFILLSCGVSLLYPGENDTFPLLYSSLITSTSGAFVYFFTRNPKNQFGKREGYIIVGLVWIIFSFFGTLPFMLSGSIPSFTDAFFETMSGFTTTGSSILNNIEDLPHGILFWRSITQWLGGMGIIVLSIAILPFLGVGGMQLFIAEVPGPTPDKLEPRIRETAKKLWVVYILFTLAEALLLTLGGMSIFDGICHALTTMATGGYSTKQASIAAYNSPFIDYVIIFFMFLAGTNFTISLSLIRGQFGFARKNEEFRFYIGFILFFTALITIGLITSQQLGLEKSFRDALFQVVSILTTTGYITADYLKWTPFLGILIFALMFFGGSAGSTGGGIKIIRVVLLLKNSYYELKRLVHPKAIIPVRFNNRSVSAEVISNVMAFFIFYFIIFFASVIVMSIWEPTIDSSLSAVATTLGNIGPGFGSVGPMSNFYHLPVFAKWFLSFLMLLGRLELFTILVLLSPTFWRK